jgi:hypothetical protein
VIGRVIKYYWPVILTLLPIIGFTIYLSAIRDTECHFIFGQSTALLSLYLFSYALPGLLFICSIYTFLFGVYGLKQGKYPPDGFPVFIRKKSYGLTATIFSITGIMLPVLAAYVIYLGIQSVGCIAEDRSFIEMNQVILKKCNGT